MEQLENLCPRCGEPYSDRGGRLRCLTCGYIKPEKATKEEEILLAAAAQKLRFADFDEAKELYADILESYPKNAEAHWGVLLCEYGIKYESDYDGKKIATCYSTRYESFYDNPHYKKAIDFADDKQREYYKSQAEFIEKVRKEWIEKASKEKPYDIFLSFRDTIDGERTEDSYGAYDLYNYLTRLGYRVFFSRVTLKDKTGENYEPYIFNALNTAKVMLVYASKPEYVTSTWVKNEWTRYLARIRAQEKRPDSLCLIIKGFNPSKLPASLKNRQLLKTEDLTYIKDLEAYLDKELKEAKITAPTIQRKEITAKAKGAAKTIESVETIDVKYASSAKKAHAKLEAVERRDIGNYVVPKLNATTESRITQAKYYLKAKDFARAESLYEEALEDAKENPTALMGLLLAKSSCVSLDEWISTKLEVFDDLSLVIKVINYSDIDTVTVLLDAYAAYIARLATEQQWTKALELYKRFGNYDTPSINALPLTLLQDAANHIVGEGCPEFIDALLPYLKTDANAYKAALVSLGEACIREKFFEKAVIAFDTYAQYYDFDHQIFLLSLEAKKECRSLEELFHALCKENDFSLISKDVPLPKNELEKLFVVVTDFALGELGSHPRDIVPLISFLVRCNFSFREGFIKRGINYCCDFPSDAISDAFDAFLSSFGEGEEKKLIRVMMKFAKAAMEVDGELARKYLGRVSEYDPNDEEPYRLRICSQCGIADGDLSNGLRRGIYDYSDIESLLSLRGKRTFFDVLKPYFDAILVSPVATVVSTFDSLCGYLPKEEDNQLIPYLEKIAEECKNDGSLFVEAEKYYALLISLKPNDSSAYWGLLQSKLRCKNDDELIEQDTPLAELPEFESAKNSVGGDELTLSWYIDCEIKQLKRHEEKESERKRKAEEDARLEAERIERIEKRLKSQRKKKRYIIFASVTTAAVTLAAFGIPLLTANVFIPSSKYSSAVDLRANGNYDEAIAVFEDLGDFKDSRNQAGLTRAARCFSQGEYEVGIAYARDAGGTVSVEYDSNGGSHIDGETIRPRWTVSVPTKTGYSFDGWAITDWTMDNYAFTLSLKADWSLIKYNITYYLEGGSFATTPPYEYDVNTPTFTIPDPRRDGYAFLGWKIGAFGSDIVRTITIETGSSRDYVLTAVWDVNSYTVTLDPNGGDVSQTSIEAEYGSQYTLPTPTRTGYKFNGWYEGSALIPSSGTWNYLSNKTLVASWSIITYNVTYVLNGGINSSSNPATYTIEDNVTLQDPSRAGYEFVEWRDANGNVVTTLGGTVIGDKTLTALWNANDYVVTLDPNGGELSQTTIDVRFGEPYELPTPTKTGYTFNGWYDGSSLIPSSGKWNYPSGKTFVASWTPIVYSVNYVLDGGTNSPSNPATYTIEDNITFQDPSKTGYEFGGWYDENSKQVTTISGSTGDLTLIASWSAKLNALSVVSENLSKGTVSIVSGSGYSDESITVAATPAEGYFFSGWYHSSDLVSSDQTYTFTMPTGDYSLVARFETIPVVEDEPILSSDGKTVTYGFYPQTRVSDSSLLSALESIALPEANGWYFYQGEYYAKRTAWPYDPGTITFDDGTIIWSGDIHWFRVEPIVWNILTQSDGVYYLLSSMLLDSRPYDDISGDSNNYADSDIRAWLNDDFYGSAFSLGNSHILTTTVDNSAKTTDSLSNPYVCEDTQDKVFLPSLGDYYNPSYGFAGGGPTSTRYCRTTDLARAGNGYVCLTSGDCQFNGCFWTRSPYSLTGGSGSAYYVAYDGRISPSKVLAIYGVRPAITIKL